MMKICKSGFKIYLTLFVLLFVICFSYGMYLSFTGTNFNVIAKLVILGVFFFLLGLFFANASQKKGWLVGILTSVIHYLLIKLCFFLAGLGFNFEILPFLICLTSSLAGGLIGVNIKKIF